MFDIEQQYFPILIVQFQFLQQKPDGILLYVEYVEDERMILNESECQLRNEDHFFKEASFIFKKPHSALHFPLYGLELNQHILAFIYILGVNNFFLQFLNEDIFWSMLLPAFFGKVLLVGLTMVSFSKYIVLFFESSKKLHSSLMLFLFTMYDSLQQQKIFKIVTAFKLSKNLSAIYFF